MICKIVLFQAINTDRGGYSISKIVIQLVLPLKEIHGKSCPKKKKKISLTECAYDALRN